MKYLSILVFGLSSAYAQEVFTTGQAARLVIGQRTFTAQIPGTSQDTLGGPSGLAYANDTLFVVDSNRLGALPLNHRVLIYRNLRSQLPSPADELFNTTRCPVCLGRADTVLGQPDFDKGELKSASATTMRAPTGVATDGTVLAVSDTDNNRVLIWNRIPQSNQTPADVVLGQPDFSRTVPNDGQGSVPSNRSFRGPQGLWIQGGKLYVADANNNRVLVWNSIPRTNHQAADLVLGQPDFNTFVQVDLTKAVIDAKQENMLTPVSVTTDGTRLFVSDLGHNRVLIWNTIPTRNNQPADVVIGQADFQGSIANNTTKVCQPEAKDPEGKDIYPERCLATLEFPRFALSDGRRLFVADGGNDRILVFSEIPRTNGAAADAVLGQITPRFNLISDNVDPRGVASSGAVRTPLSLAFDGLNLYASDPFNRRIMVFTPGERIVPNTGVRNSASREIFAVGGITMEGNVKENDEFTLKVKGPPPEGQEAKEVEYKYKAKKDDGFDQVILGVVAAVNAPPGNPYVLATPNLTRNAILLTARAPGAPGDEVEYSVSSTGTEIVTQTTGARLAGGEDATQIAPGTVVSIFGENLSSSSAGADPNARELPTELAGVQVYFDGIRAPLYSVTPTEIRAQVPWEVIDTQSINAFVRTRRADGSIAVSTAISVPVIPQNPGIFALENQPDPRPGLIMHGSPRATGTVSVDGSIRANDVATVTIEDRRYSYTVKTGDTLATVRDALVEEINKDPRVEAIPSAAFTRIRLRARVPGPEGNGIEYSARSRDGDEVILTATTPRLCCANSGPVTLENPAQPGETIILTATGLGIVKGGNKEFQRTGEVYEGDALNDPLEFVSSLAGAKTANVLSAGMKPGAIGLFEVVLELNADLPTDPLTQVTIAQDVYVSNIVTFPLVNPNSPIPPQ